MLPLHTSDHLAEGVSGRSKQIAQWLLVGFIHGVMNTENMSIAGETTGRRNFRFPTEADHVQSVLGHHDFFLGNFSAATLTALRRVAVGEVNREHHVGVPHEAAFQAGSALGGSKAGVELQSPET
jgi:hypothetical protein